MRYIDADKLAEKIKQCAAFRNLKSYYFESNIIKNVVLDLIDNAPTADVVEVKHGEWKQGVPYVCSICGKPAPDEKNTSERYSCWTSPYCPHCGAKMEIVVRDDMEYKITSNDQCDENTRFA